MPCPYLFTHLFTHFVWGWGSRVRGYRGFEWCIVVVYGWLWLELDWRGYAILTLPAPPGGPHTALPTASHTHTGPHTHTHTGPQHPRTGGLPAQWVRPGWPQQPQWVSAGRTVGWGTVRSRLLDADCAVQVQRRIHIRIQDHSTRGLVASQRSGSVRGGVSNPRRVSAGTNGSASAAPLRRTHPRTDHQHRHRARQRRLHRS